MATAKWKKESTFRRHYLRGIAPEGKGQDAFQATVLQEGYLQASAEQVEDDDQEKDKTPKKNKAPCCAENMENILLNSPSTFPRNIMVWKTEKDKLLCEEVLLFEP
ncbi:hypothetical protein OS493_006898 [Desmophyllum pertusum]|uniref:Uncharacterized protein n=1 Tax=Desmophyllum pertusum TaxID=174260 RepID=A0A9X0D4S5_9CNID|nr:hypothetical protein OS493_006898 [Desmophyllum pertusum]